MCDIEYRICNNMNIIEDYIRNVTFVNSILSLVQLSQIRYALEDIKQKVTK